MGITHAFTNPKSDGADTTIVRPSDWNADHVGGVFCSTFGAARDTYLQKNAATTNYGSSTELKVQGKWDGSSSYSLATLIAFDVSSLADKTIYRAELDLYMISKSNSTDEASGQNSVLVRRNLRAWVEAEATWTIYSTGNNWTSGGANTDASDVENDIACWGRHFYMPGPGGSGVVLTGSEAGFLTIDVTPLLAKTIGASGTELNLQLTEYVTPSSQNPTVFASSDHATTAYQPRLVVWHD